MYSTRLKSNHMDTDTPDERGKWYPFIVHAAEVGIGYRLINDFETIEKGDEYLDDNEKWITTGEWGVCKGSLGVFRRKVAEPSN